MNPSLNNFYMVSVINIYREFKQKFEQHKTNIILCFILANFAFRNASVYSLEIDKKLRSDLDGYISESDNAENEVNLGLEKTSIMPILVKNNTVFR